MPNAAETKEFSLSQIANHDTRESCWVVIHGKVYDVTKFLEEHPGGEDVVLDVAGHDATEEFEDTGHSAAARELLPKYEIGFCLEKDDTAAKKEQQKNDFPPVRDGGGFFAILRMLLPLILVTVAILYNYYRRDANVA